MHTLQIHINVSIGSLSIILFFVCNYAVLGLQNEASEFDCIVNQLMSIRWLYCVIHWCRFLWNAILRLHVCFSHYAIRVQGVSYECAATVVPRQVYAGNNEICVRLIRICWWHYKNLLVALFSISITISNSDHQKIEVELLLSSSHNWRRKVGNQKRRHYKPSNISLVSWLQIDFYLHYCGPRDFVLNASVWLSRNPQYLSLKHNVGEYKPIHKRDSICSKLQTDLLHHYRILNVLDFDYSFPLCCGTDIFYFSIYWRPSFL